MSAHISHQPTNDVPEPVARVADLMAAFRPWWALCGGWAVDAWLGRQTRDHADVDICAFIEHQRVIFDHLVGWRLVAHLSGDTHEPWDGRRLVLPNHIQGRLDVDEVPPGRGDAAAKRSFDLDIQLNDRCGDDWILSQEPRISLARRSGVRRSPWGLPTVVPEVLLFFKARDLNRRDKLDFFALLPHLSVEQRRWLRDALSLLGHPWLSQLSP